MTPAVRQKPVAMAVLRDGIWYLAMPGGREVGCLDEAHVLKIAARNLPGTDVRFLTQAPSRDGGGAAPSAPARSSPPRAGAPLPSRSSGAGTPSQAVAAPE